MTTTARSKVAVVGVGYTPITRDSGRTVASLALQACSSALADAGLRPADVDGMVSASLMGDSVATYEVAARLGVPQLRWFNDFNGGGWAAASTITEAAWAIATGACRTAIVFRAMNGRSGYRMGNYGADLEARGAAQFKAPFGYGAMPYEFAMYCRRHMHEHGTTQEQLGAVAIQLRRNAANNPRAILGHVPLDMASYLASRFIAEPFRLPDCTLEVDGACALVLTSADHARSLRRPPVYIVDHALAQIPDWEQGGNLSEMAWPAVAKQLWARSGLRPADMDFAQLYDCFTFTLLTGLEGMGFCERGQGGPFVQTGGIALDGPLPVNTAGGLLSEGFLHGLNLSCEAVLQLRGEAGANQVQDAKVGLVTAGGQGFGGALIYANEPI